MTHDVIIVGAGVVGLSTAWQAAERGLNVAVVSAPAATAASNAAVGGLSFCLTDAVLAGEQAVIDLSVSARDRFPGFIEALEQRSGMPTRFRRQATLMTRQANEDPAVLDRVEKARAVIGLASVRLPGDECRELEPTLSAQVHEGLLLEEHDQIDSMAFTRALGQACVNAGVTMVSGSVTTLTIGGDRAAGVVLASGEQLLAGQVVIAAGAWSGEIEGSSPELIGCVRPIAGQIVVLGAPPGLVLPQRDLRNDRVYIVTRSDDTVLIGATRHDKGFDGTATAGNVRFLLNEAEALWPPVAMCSWLRTVVGMRPKSIDGLPIVGETSISGVFAATGHYKNGIMFAAETADAMVSMLTGEPVAPSFAAFSPRRLTVQV